MVVSADSSESCRHESEVFLGKKYLHEEAAVPCGRLFFCPVPDANQKVHP